MHAKIHDILDKTAMNTFFLRFLIKKSHFFLSVRKKGVPLQRIWRNARPRGEFHFHQSNMKLGYGVMVTLQILVLPFLVRVRVPQQFNPLSH